MRKVTGITMDKRWRYRVWYSSKRNGPGLIDLSQEMETDDPMIDKEKIGSHKKLQSLNTNMAVLMIVEFLRYTSISRFLYLVSSNRYEEQLV